jgi:uncharacterized protein (DUF1697 family)
MPRQIALLRGINVGKHRRVGMGPLRELLTELGYGDVQTHLQSGNILLDSKRTGARLERELAQQIEEGLGVDPLVVVRTRDELAAVVAHDPLGDVADNPKLYQVTFLSKQPDAEHMDAIEALDVAPERVVVHGREIYAWHPSGVQRSKLAAALTDKKLGVTATARNWNTVKKLLELADG